MKIRLLTLCSLLLIPVLVRAADTPREQLLSLVHREVGLLLEADDLKTTLPAFWNSEFTGRVRQLPLYQRWTESEDFRELLKFRDQLEELTGQPARQFARELFGQSVMLAVYPQREGEPVGVLLLGAENEPALAGAVAAWNRADAPKLTPLNHRGVSFTERTRPGGQTQYYLTLGAVFILSDHRPAVEQAIDLHRDQQETGEAASLVGYSLYRQARESLHPNTVLAAFVNIARWDDGRMSENVVQEFLRNCDTLVAGLRLEQGLVGELILAFPESQPEPLQAVIRQTTGPAAFLDRVPENAFLVMAGRMDFRLPGQLANSLPDLKKEMASPRQILRGLLGGYDPLDDILPLLQADCGLFLVPPENPTTETLPFNALAAFALNTADPEKAAALRQGLDNALNTGLNLLSALHNSQNPPEPAVVKFRLQDGVTLRWLESILGYRPGYALSDSFLALTNNPELATRFIKDRPERSIRLHPQFAEASRRYFPEENQVLFVNLKSLRNHLRDNQTLFIQQKLFSQPADRPLTPQENLRRQELVTAQLARVQELLGIGDTAFAAARLQPTQFRLTTGLVVQEGE